MHFLLKAQRITSGTHCNGHNTQSYAHSSTTSFPFSGPSWKPPCLPEMPITSSSSWKTHSSFEIRTVVSTLTSFPPSPSLSPPVLLQSAKPLFCAHHIVIQQNIAPGFQLPPWLVCSLRPRAISLLEPQRTEHLLCANKGCQFCGHKSRAKRTKRSVTVLNNKQIK